MKTELLSLLNELPELYKGIVSSIGSLKNATHYYEAFVNFLVPRCVTQHTSYSLCKYIYCIYFFSASRLEPCTCDTYCTTHVYVNQKMQIKRAKNHMQLRIKKSSASKNRMYAHDLEILASLVCMR